MDSSLLEVTPLDVPGSLPLFTICTVLACLGALMTMPGEYARLRHLALPGFIAICVSLIVFAIATLGFISRLQSADTAFDEQLAGTYGASTTTSQSDIASDIRSDGYADIQINVDGTIMDCRLTVDHASTIRITDTAGTRLDPLAN